MIFIQGPINLMAVDRRQSGSRRGRRPSIVVNEADGSIHLMVNLIQNYVLF